MTHSISALFISLLASLALLAMPVPSFASPAVLGTRKPAPVQAKAPVPAAPAQPAAAPAVSPTAPSAPAAPAPAPQPPADPITTVTLSAAGDCTLGTEESFGYEGTFPEAWDAAGGDGSVFLAGVRSVFDQDDLTLVNMEGPLTTRGERQDKTFAFRGDPAYVEVLKTGSVEAASLANNHSYDYGNDGYWDTFKTLGDTGIMPFGYEESQILTVKGIPVGLVGINALEAGAPDQLQEELTKVKERGARLTVVFFHWGSELETRPDEDQVWLAHLAVDQGADLVLGAHPHVIQPLETYKGRTICYSLGNFCFGGNSNPRDKDTFIYQQTFRFQKGRLLGADPGKVIPCRISSTPDWNDFRPTLVEGEEAERIREKAGVAGRES
ncbi:CapA family protein [Acidaminococcus fermentans]|uniref:CapA family protein n=1 Tax=Acidaminococcus fermentans TaxID=905 RepID=UPI002431D25A|nr:CapA family protein [Acidaminococcus fermentans]MDY4146771.1 CapA family protein [Acidaminococcus fermentans]